MIHLLRQQPRTRRDGNKEGRIGAAATVYYDNACVIIPADLKENAPSRVINGQYRLQIASKIHRRLQIPLMTEMRWRRTMEDDLKGQINNNDGAVSCM